MADVSTVPLETSDNTSEQQVTANLQADATLAEGDHLGETPDTASEHLPVVDIVEEGTEATQRDAEGNPILTAEALMQTAQELYNALHPGFLQGYDTDKVKRILMSLNADDANRLEAAYAQLPSQTSLLADLEPVGDREQRTIEMYLDKEDGEVNVVGNIAIGLETARENPIADGHVVSEGGKLVIEALSSIKTNEDLETFKAEWLARYPQYGKFEDAINASSLAEADKWLINNVFALNPETRDVATMTGAATYLLEEMQKPGNQWYAEEYLARFDAVFGGDSQLAIDTRRALKGTEFASAYEAEYSDHSGKESEKQRQRAAMDLLTEGKHSLASMVINNMRNDGEYWNAYRDSNFLTSQNPDAVIHSLESATERERTSYIAGRDLVTQGITPTTVEQQEQVDYYNKMQAAFAERGTPLQQVIWADIMEHGDKTLISSIAEMKDGGAAVSEMVSAVEGMTEQDWEALRSQNGVQSDYMTRMKAVVDSLPDEETRLRLTAMLDQAAGAESFAAAKEVRRSVMDVLGDNAEDIPGRNIAIAEAILAMSPEDAAAYKAGGDLKTQLDAIFFPAIADYYQKGSLEDRAALVLGQQLLTQIAETGKQPTLDLVAQSAKTLMEGEISSDDANDVNARMQMMDTLMHDETIFARAKGVDAASETQDFSSTPVADLALTQLISALDPHMGDGFRQLIDGHEIGMGTQALYGGGVLEGHSFYTQTLDMDEEERAIEEHFMSEDEKEILTKVAESGGEMRPVDELRSFIIGDQVVLDGTNVADYKTFLEKFAAMPADQQTALTQQYESVYGRESFTEDFMAAALRSNPSPEYMAVLDKLKEQNFRPSLADEMRLYVLSGNHNYEDFAAKLALLDYDQRQALKDEYATTYKTNLENDFLSTIDNNFQDTIKFANLLRTTDVDPVQDYLDRLRTLDTTGVDADGTKEAVERALQINAELLEQYSTAREGLPPEIRAAFDAQFELAVNDFRDSKKNAAETLDRALQIVVAVAAIGSVPLSGGLSLTVLGVGATAAVARPVALEATLGDGMVTEDQLREAWIHAGLDVSLLAVPGVATHVLRTISEARAAKAATEVLATTEGAAVTKTAAELKAAAEEAATVVLTQTRVADDAAALAATAEREALDAATRIQAAKDAIALRQADQTVIDAANLRALALKQAEDAALIRNADDAAALGTVDNTASLGAIDEAAALKALNERQLAEQTAKETARLQAARDAQLIRDADAAALRAAAEKAALEKATLEANRLKAAQDAALIREADAAAAAKKLAEAEAATLATVDAGTIATRSLAAVDATINGAEIIQDFTPPVEEEAPALPTAALIEAATVRRGEGPWQSAERILASDGKPHSIDEVRALVKAIQAVYAADNSGNGDMSGLKVNYTFITNDNFDELIAATNNESVKALLMGLAA